MSTAGNAEGKFDYVAGEVHVLKRAGRVVGEVFVLGCPIAGCRENEFTDSARGGNIGLSMVMGFVFRFGF